jgi:predicted site-specific integrase-resolvase
MISSPAVHIHPNTLRRWSDDGRIKAYRITAERRYKRQEIACFPRRLNTSRVYSGKATDVERLW